MERLERQIDQLDKDILDMDVALRCGQKDQLVNRYNLSALVAARVALIEQLDTETVVKRINQRVTW